MVRGPDQECRLDGNSIQIGLPLPRLTDREPASRMMHHFPHFVATRSSGSSSNRDEDFQNSQMAQKDFVGAWHLLGDDLVEE